MRLVAAQRSEPAGTPVRLPSFAPSIRAVKQRLLCFDLENRPLAYWYDGQTTSEITAFSWKWHDEACVRSLLLKRDGRFYYYALAPGDKQFHEPPTYSDESAYVFFSEVLSKADIVYGHNIRRHDLPMLNAGLLRRQLPVLPPLLTSDTLTDYPKRAGMSRSLENLASMYGLEGDKLKMTQPMWEKANRLSPDGMDLARERVEGDVLLQERLRVKLVDLGILKPAKWWRP